MAPVLYGFLLAAIVPLAKKLLVALGIGWITYEGFSFIAAQLHDQITSAWGGVGGVTLQILSLAGVPTAIGIMLGAFSAKAALLAIARLGRVAS